MTRPRSTRIANALLRHWAPLFAIVLLATAAALWRVARLDVDADMLSLLREDDPVAVQYRETLADAPSARALMLVFPGRQAGALEQAASELKSLDSVELAMAIPSESKDLVVLGVVLGHPVSDIESSRASMRLIRDALARKGIEAELTGSPAVLVEAHDTLLRDLRRATVIAVASVAAFYLFFYPAGWLALAAMVPIGMGILWGLAAGGFAGRSLTLLAATVPTLLVGLGIDYSIHLIRGVSLRIRAGCGKREAVVRAWASVIRPLAAGAATTAAAFLSLAFAELRGLADMGWMGTFCTLGVFLATAAIIPVFLAWCPESWLSRESALGRHMPRLAWVSQRASGRVLAGALVLTVVGLAGLAQLRLETDLGRLGNPDLPSRRLQDKLAFEAGIAAAPLLARFDSPDEARRFAAPRAHVPEAGRLLANVTLVPTERGTAAILHPKENPFERRTYLATMEAISKLGSVSGAPPRFVAGAPVVNERLGRRLRGDLARIFLVCAVGVAVAMAVGVGPGTGVLLGAIPLVAGLAWTGGAMGFLGFPLSVMSVAVAPLVIGIGADDGVHLLAAWRRPDATVESAFRETGVALVATTATTVAAFGSLTFSSTPALVEFGWQAAVGLSLCLLAGLAVLPCAHVRMRRHGGRP